MPKLGKRALLAMIAIVLNVVILAGIVFLFIQGNNAFKTLNGRILYLQDTLSIMQTEMNNMKDEIRTTVEEENSLLEEHDFEIIDMNFAENTYTLKMTIIPKDYKESTNVSVFFGTTQFDLEAGEFFFTGTAELPFDSSFAGNVTVVLKNGDAKNTEVLHDYDGFVNDFSAMLKATAMATPTIKDGSVNANGPARIELNAKDRFSFVRCNLWVEVNGQKVFGRDYFKYIQDSLNQDSISDYDVEGDGILEQLYEAKPSFLEADGSKMTFDVEKNDEVHIYVEALTEEGYLFAYDVFRGTVDAEGNKFTESSIVKVSNSRMTDRYGNVKIFAAKNNNN